MTGSQLPQTFRPRWGRWVVWPALVGVVGALVFGGVAVPGFTPVERGYLLAFAGLAGWLLWRLARLRIECDEAGLTVVNIVRRRRLEWAEVLGVRLDRGDPWLVLDLSDGTALPAMGVQGSDGAYAQEQARRLARLVVDHTRTARDD